MYRSRFACSFLFCVTKRLCRQILNGYTFAGLCDVILFFAMVWKECVGIITDLKIVSAETGHLLSVNLQTGLDFDVIKSKQPKNEYDFNCIITNECNTFCYTQKIFKNIYPDQKCSLIGMFFFLTVEKYEGFRSPKNDFGDKIYAGYD